MAKYSSWREGAVAVKAARQAPVVDDAPATRHVPNKRDTKRWCKGKVGREHKPAVKTYSELKNWQGIKGMATDIWQGWVVQYCTECGKELDHYSPPWGNVALYRKPPPPPPAWAEEYFADHPEARPVQRSA
jgi:hypothetical protein